MRKLYTALVLTLMVLPLVAQNIPSYVPKDGLVGYWPFNGNANDESGNGNHGFVKGATLTEDRNGVADNAYSFDGVSNRIEVSHNQTLNCKSVSISVWFNTNTFIASNGYGPHLVSKREISGWGNSFQMNVGIEQNQNACWADWSITNNSGIYYFNSTDINKSKWYNLIYTHDGTNVKLYLNGKLVQTIDSPGYLTFNTLPLWFGARPNAADYSSWYNGKLDDIAIYNRALTQQEITALFTNTPLKENIPSYIPKDGLVGYWPFNGNARDESGNANNGTEYKVNYVSDRNGKSNAAINFSQDKLSKVLVEGGVKNSKGLVKTMSVWFNMPKTYPKENYYNILVDAKGPIWKYDSTSYQKEGDCMININGDLDPYPSIGYLNKISVQAEKPGNQMLVNDSIWHHLIVEVNCVDNKIKEFFDGTFVQEYKLDYYPTSISDWEFLAFGNNARHCPECAFSGHLDDISIYNRSLTQQEITQLYTNCPKETAASSSFNSVLFTNGNAVSITAEPQGGVFSGSSIENNQFIPSKAKIGSNKVKYNFKNSQGCADSTVFNMVVADTVGKSCTKFDTVIVKNNVFDTVKVNKYDTITITNNVTKYDTVIVPKTVTKYDTVIVKTNVFDTVKVNKYDTITITKNVTKYDTVIVKTNVFDTVKVNTYDTITITNNITKFDTIIVKTNVFDTVKVNKYDTITVTNNITKYDTVIVKTNVFDTVKVNKYDTITVTNNVTKYDTVKVTKFDTITVTNNVTKYDTVIVNKTNYDTVGVLKIKFKLTTGINANQLSSLSIYPNPTSDVLHIEVSDAKALEGYRYRILDALGKEVYNELVTQTTTEIPLKTLGAAGIYQFEILDATKTSIQSNKIVLQ